MPARSLSATFWRRLELTVLGAFLLQVGQLGLQRLETLVDVEVALLLDLAELFEQFGLEGGLVDVALVLVDPGHEVGHEVDDLLELLGLELFTCLGAHEQVREPRTRATQVPDATTGAASSMWPMRSRRTLERVTSTPQRSQVMPLNRTRLYLPQ